MNDDAILTTRGLTKRFRRRDAVRNLSIEVRSGDIYGFLGLNGAGKTTTIRMLCGLCRPSAGNIEIFGLRADRERARVRIARDLGALVEVPAFYNMLSGATNLDLLYSLTGTPRRQRRVETARVLDLVGLAERARSRVSEYSQGMRQRLGIAAALLGRPRLVILDEPTNGLDPRGIQEMRALVLRIARDEGATVLLSSHLLSEVEGMCTRVGIIDQGVMIAEGTMDALLHAERAVWRVSCDDPARAALVLKEAGIEISPPIGGALECRLQREEAPDVLARLVSAGIRVSEFSSQRRSLEDFFLSLTDARSGAAPP